MDSVKNEGPTAIIVDDIVVAPTNGVNGVFLKHEESSGGGGNSENMKTRSKMVDGEGANPAQKRTARAVKNDEKVVDLKGGKTVADTKAAAAAKDAVTASAKVSQSGSASTTTSKKTKTEEAMPPGSAKKKTNDRDDDSGVNSRASSVSNDDIVTPPRMRTRSSKITVTSTPSSSYKKGQERLPLSAYDFDDIIEEDELMTLNSLKRKAVVYVEEMEDEDTEQQKEPSEPLAKRAFRNIGQVGSSLLMSPFRALGGKLTLRRGAAAAATAAVDEQQQKNAVDNVEEKQPEKAQETAAEQPPAVTVDGQQNTCILM